MRRKITKILIYVLLALVVGTIGTFVWVDYELNKILGKSTEVIDISSIVKPVSIIQIQNVAILSEDCSHFVENQNVLVKDGKIVSISPDSIIDNSAKIIDGTGKYLIPGLIDSHVHLKESKNDLYLYLVNGVTSVREMSGRLITLDWKKSINDRSEIGPKMYVTSPSVSSISGLEGAFHSWTRKTINYTNREDAKKAILKVKEQGYDAIKMYSFVNAEMFKATIEIAKENDIPVIGHIPQVDLTTFYQGGQKEVAHVEELVKKNMKDFGKSVTKNPEEFLNYLKSHATQIAEKLKENKIYVTTTVALMESLVDQKFDLKSKLKAIELEYVNPKVIEGTSVAKIGWLPTRNGYEGEGLDDLEYKKKEEIFWNTYVAAIGLMTESLIENHVPIFVGTDTNVSPMVPGFSLHEELAALAGHGMANSQVLYSATVGPSEWMGNKTGKIKEGYDSDLLLLSKNPLDDIANTKTIEYVFFDQYAINENQIEHILKAIKDANNKNRTVDINEFID